MFRNEPNYKELKSFGSLCFHLLPKIFERQTRCIFLCYAKDHKGYKCLRCDDKDIFISKNVRFHENSFLGFEDSYNQDRDSSRVFSHLQLLLQKMSLQQSFLS